MLKRNDEELILGYIFEALDQNESDAITDRLHKDDGFRRNYDTVTAGYLPAMAAREDAWERMDPPQGLASRTMDFIRLNAPRASKIEENEYENQHLTAAHALTQVHQAVNATSFGNVKSDHFSPNRFSPSVSGDAPAAQLSETVTGQLLETRVSKKDTLNPANFTAETAPAEVRPQMSEQPESGRRSRSRVLDTLAALSILGVVSLLLIQVVVTTREQTRIETCSSNLRQIGQAFQQYSALNAGFFPSVKQVENSTHQIAGIYGPLLLEKEFIQPECLFCPSASAGNLPVVVPRYSQLVRSGGTPESGQLLHVGGDYAYNIGYTENGQYHPVKNLQRANYVLLADAPVKLRGCENACNLDLRPAENGLAHGKYGMNMLFEDGHVELVTRPEVIREDGTVDAVFYNDRGEIAPGIGPSDIVLGRSEVRVPCE